MIIEIVITGVLGLQAFSHGVAFFALIRVLSPDIKSGRCLCVPAAALPCAQNSHVDRGSVLAARHAWLRHGCHFSLGYPAPRRDMAAPCCGGRGDLDVWHCALFRRLARRVESASFRNIDTTIALVINAAIIVVVVGWLTGQGWAADTATCASPSSRGGIGKLCRRKVAMGEEGRLSAKRRNFNLSRLPLSRPPTALTPPAAPPATPPQTHAPRHRRAAAAATDGCAGSGGSV